MPEGVGTLELLTTLVLFGYGSVSLLICLIEGRADDADDKASHRDVETIELR
jgi:hypothetical protein